jgi:dihydrofolate reductase
MSAGMPHTGPLVALIAAVARNGVIGRGAELVFRDPLDAQHFKQATWGHPVIMGRKTWDSLPARFRPLPGRRNVVVTRNEAWQSEGAEAIRSLSAALALVAPAPLAFVIGGGELYAQALPLAQRLVLTQVDADLPGDILFPPWPREAFELSSRTEHQARDGTPFAICTYERRRAQPASQTP